MAALKATALIVVNWMAWFERLWDTEAELASAN
jgi:hypothetical protein